jgi:hypothetical protein
MGILLKRFGNIWEYNGRDLGICGINIWEEYLVTYGNI